VEVLNLIHVGGAVLWAGSALFVYLFLTPAAEAAGEAAGPFMAALTRGRLTMAMTIAAHATVLSGIWLWFLRFDGPPSSDLSGAALSIGALAGLTAFGIAMGRQLPTIKAMKAQGAAIATADGPPSAEQVAAMGELRARMATNARLLAFAVGVAVIGMALGG